jgi:hypothetical protein
MSEQIQFQLRSKTPEQLVELFNKEVGVTHWVSARSRFLHALRDAFERQGIDYSRVTNETGGFNLARGNEVFLVGKRLCLLE